MGSRVEKDLYEMLFDALPQAVLVVDRQLKIQVGNKSASALFQVSKDQLREAEISSLISHKDLPKLIFDVAEAQRGKVLELHPESDQQRSSERILRVTILPLDPYATEDVGLLVLEDVSEKVMLEEQLIETEKLAGMGQLAQGIAHELGNPLSSMGSTLQYVRENITNEGDSALLEALDLTLDNLDQMHHLLRSLSEFSREHRPRYEASDLHQLIRQSLVFIRREAEKHGIRPVTSFASTLPCCHIDVRRIKQVLLNLFKNAIEAMPEGGQLSVKTRLGRLAREDSEAAIIEIRDTGMGISRKELRHVFRPLYSTKPKGTGLSMTTRACAER
ncbi:ATP-binding protein [Acidobacteria bacterium AH-259-O06]|nr:ATP-binding protein [Acidobacteria bacterium AH-259-O06]